MSNGSKWLRRLAIGALAAGILNLVALDTLSYVDGRRGSVFFLPSIFLLLSALGFIFVLFTLMVVSLIRRQERRKTLGCLVTMLVLLSANSSIPPAGLFRIGFRHRLKATITADELRLIASRCLALVPEGGKLPSPGKLSLWTESDHGGAWKALTNETAIAKLDDALCVYNHGDEVQILWGGAWGHWGVTIATNLNSAQGDFAAGIKTVYGSH